MLPLQAILPLHRFRLVNVECLRVDTIVYHLVVIILQERVLHLLFHPFRNRDNGKQFLRHRGECFPFIAEVLPRAIDEIACRELPPLWTIATFLLPLVTPRK